MEGKLDGLGDRQSVGACLVHGWRLAEALCAPGGLGRGAYEGGREDKDMYVLCAWKYQSPATSFDFVLFKMGKQEGKCRIFLVSH